MKIGAYQVEEVHAKPNKVRTGEQWTRGLNVGILVKSLFERLTYLFSNVLLVV